MHQGLFQILHSTLNVVKAFMKLNLNIFLNLLSMYQNIIWYLRHFTKNKNKSTGNKSWNNLYLVQQHNQSWITNFSTFFSFIKCCKLAFCCRINNYIYHQFFFYFHTDQFLVEMFHNYAFIECISVENLKLWLLIFDTDKNTFLMTILIKLTLGNIFI